MNKAIKKELIKQLREKSPPEEWEKVISRYMDDIAGSDKAVILTCRYIRGWGYWRTLRELNRQGFYMSQTVFYQHLDDALGGLALYAAYEKLIYPYAEAGK